MRFKYRYARHLSHWAIILASLLTVTLTGCSDRDPQQEDLHPEIYEVSEVYKTGQTVVVRALEVDTAKQHLWVGTSTGVNQVDYKTGHLVNSYTRENGLANEYVFAINVDSKGRKWFGTNAGGVSVLQDGQFKTYFPMHGLADYWVYSFVEQEDGRMWVGTWAGVNLIDPVTDQFETYVEEVINEWVYGMDIDSKQHVWFGTEGGVSRYDGKSWIHWTHKDGMGAANSGMKPVSSNTGLGTRNRHDLGVLSGGQATYNPNYVFALTVDSRDDSVWVGTWGGGVSHFNGTSWQNYTVSDGLSGNIVYAVYQARDGAMWFGTNGGISRFDGKNWQRLSLRQHDVGSDVYAITETDDGVIWAGTRGAVSKLKPIASEQDK